MKSNIEKLPKSTVKITVSIESDILKKTYEKVLDEAVKTANIEGFRPGTAPREMVKEKIGQNKLFGETINEVLETYYPQALKENAILPVSDPKVEVKEFNLEKDLEFSATVAVRPEIKVNDYRSKLKQVFEKKLLDAEEELKKSQKPGEEKSEPHVHLSPNEVIEAILSSSEVEISDLLLEDETDRLLSRFVDQAQSIGLSLEQYLKSQNKTGEQLRREYGKIAENNIKAEFALSELIKTEKIEVSNEEVESMIKAAGDPKLVKADDPMQRLYIKSILQKNKLITKLIEETEGDKHHDH